MERPVKMWDWSAQDYTCRRSDRRLVVVVHLYDRSEVVRATARHKGTIDQQQRSQQRLRWRDNDAT
jgi:hypothetical protein